MNHKFFVAGFAATLFILPPLVGWANAKSNQRTTPAFEEIIVTSVIIEPQILPGAAERADQESLRQRLAQAATAQAQSDLVKRRLTARTRQTNQTDTQTLRFTATIRLPLSVPPGVIGLRAHDREGVLAIAQVSLQDAAGRTLAEETALLQWDDVRWLRGARPWKRNRALDDVLVDAARKSMARAVERLAQRKFNWSLGATIPKSPV